MKLNIKKIIIASLLVWIIGTVITWLTCGWLFQWVYTLPPVSLWKSSEAMANPVNVILGALIGLIVAFLFVAIYAVIQKAISGKGYRKGMRYGLIVWLIGSLSGLLGLPLYMNISPVVVVYWIIQALVVNLINGAVVGVVYK
ncbi:hypothetical protein GF386_06710 [Candidatus Pacearchaeota archaeon]|nr:hypothetical protein [Candidatus Pacearchaeota archaeon]